MSGSGRRGATLVEALVALLLGLVVMQLGLSTLARFRTVQRELAARADALIAQRVGRHVLRRELRHSLAGRDWVTDADSLALRAFRGTGIACASDSAAAALIVAYRGDRAPDAAKDSVLLVAEDGTAAVRALVGVGTAPACAATFPGGSARWTLDAAAPPGTVIARVFERGSYHLAASALRYRRGASGRQPLTPEVWSASTAWETSGERLGVELVPTGPGHSWRGFLAWKLPE
jgi:hypothetical protein